MAALSPHAATRPIDPASRWRVRVRRNFRLRNYDPLSLWTTQPTISPRIATAFSSARTARLDFLLESIEYPTILLPKTSVIAQR